MFLEIIKIGELEESKIKGHSYRLISLKSDKGEFFRMFLDPQYRNWKRWRRYLKVGNRFAGNFRFKSHDILDADSYFFLMDGKRLEESEKSKAPETLEECAKLGIFG